MRILTYAEREELKGPGHTERDTDYAHWHRFLQSVYHPLRGNVLTPDGYLLVADERKPAFVPNEVYPDFETYRAWTREFPGWSDGELTRTHAAWKPEYAKRQLPMNELWAKRKFKGRISPSRVLRLFD